MTTLSTTSLLFKQKHTLSANICDKYVGWSINYFSQATEHYTSCANENVQVVSKSKLQKYIYCYRRGSLL